MDGNGYRIVTSGEVQSGYVLNEVKKKLAELCQYEQRKVDQIFLGNKFTFKENVDLKTARHFKKLLDATGIICHVELIRSVEVKSESIATPEAGPPPTNTVDLTECPKCGMAIDGEIMCPVCGIVFEKYFKRLAMDQQAKESSD